MSTDIKALIAELGRLAEAATPGRHGDRRPECGGGLKYECKGDDGSTVLIVDHKNEKHGFIGPNGEADEKFFLACSPAAIQALLQHIAGLERDARRYAWLKNNSEINFRRPMWFSTVNGVRIHSTMATSLEMDGAIDAALAEQGEPK